jgi:hypothetical protein
MSTRLLIAIMPRKGRMVATSDFSGLTSAACALASAVMSDATVSLDRGMYRLRLEQVKADGASLGALCSHAVPDRLLGVLWDQGFKLTLGALVLKERVARSAIE